MEKEAHQRIRERKLEVAERMLREDEWFRKKEETSRTNAELAKAHFASLGRKDAERRTREYLHAITGGKGLEVGGRGGKPFFPSDVVMKVDHSFGTGKNPRLSKDKARALVRGSGETGREERALLYSFRAPATTTM